VATFQDWSVYSYSGPAGRVCYAATQPTQTLPTGVNRDPIFFLLSIWPEREIIEEANIIMGYPLEVNSTVTVTIDNNQVFNFFVRDDAAWIRDLEQEQALVVAIRRGITMVVRGRSQRGTDTTDTYSLRGATAALQRAGTECGVAP
jgi:hypothetical protein